MHPDHFAPSIIDASSPQLVQSLFSPDCLSSFLHKNDLTNSLNAVKFCYLRTAASKFTN